MKKTNSFEASKEHIFYWAIYEFNKGFTATKATRKICGIYGENGLIERTCQRWFLNFRMREFEFRKKEGKKREKKYNLDSISELLKENPFFTIREMSYYLDIPRSTIFRYLKELGKGK